MLFRSAGENSKNGLINRAEKIASPEYGGNKTVAAMRCYKIFIKYTGERCGISGGVEGKIRHKRSVSGYLGII